MEEKAIQFAKDLRFVFDDMHNELDEMGMPFFYSFPKNSCQGASVLLGLFLTWLFPNAKVSVVKGSNRKRDEHHYWVMLNSKAYDLTIDQFHSYLADRYQYLDMPLYAHNKHPLCNYFFFKEELKPIEAFSLFCNEAANLREVIKIQKIVIGKLRNVGWNI